MERLHEFTPPLISIQGGILLASDGALYASSSSGGVHRWGGIFRVEPNGLGFRVLHDFDSIGGYGSQAALIEGLDGLLYGTAQHGGSGGGTVFRMKRDGTGFQVLHQFSKATGAFPHAAVLQGADGALYGTTSQGGMHGKGTIFRVQPDGSNFTVLHSFSGPDGESPRTALVQGGDGALYGTTYAGGAWSAGTVFRIEADGSSFQTLQSLDPVQGGNPTAALVEASDGAFYGTTSTGGANAFGSLFRLERNGSAFEIVYSFERATGYPWGGVAAVDGWLYGASAHGSRYEGILYRVRPDGSDFTVLHIFNGLDGAWPIRPLVHDGHARFYGVTQSGGTSNYGTVFELQVQPTIQFRTIHSLKDEVGHGSNPNGGVVEGPDGALYKTTSQGGEWGSGTVFRVERDGTGFRVLHSFPWKSHNMGEGLLVGQDGALYGTTEGGGDFGAGMVFSLNPDGSAFRIVHSFAAGPGQPFAGVVQGPDGTLYGTTFNVVFRVQTDGSGFTHLHDLNGVEGSLIRSRLTLDSEGTLFGSTHFGGVNGYGTLFRIGTDGNDFEVLHSMSEATDGQLAGGLVIAPDGKIYGTALLGGPQQNGTIFRLNPDGSDFTVLHDFPTTSGSPRSIVALRDGHLIGATDHGVIFAIRPGGTQFEVLHSFDFNPSGAPRVLHLGSDGTFYVTAWRGVEGGGDIHRMRFDRDGDGVLDGIDNCSLAKNASQRDRDGDGVGDACDEAPLPLVSVRRSAASEGGAAEFRVALSRAGSEITEVEYETAGGTARPHEDYVPASGTLTFLPGETVQTVQVSFVSDGLDEYDEELILRLSSATNADLDVAKARGTILDVDPSPEISVLGTVAWEGATSSTVVFPIRLSRPSGRDVSVRFTTIDGTAVAPSDYAARAGSLTIPAGEELGLAEVAIEGDLNREPAEFFWLVLSAPVNAAFGQFFAPGILLNDDP